MVPTIVTVYSRLCDSWVCIYARNTVLQSFAIFEIAFSAFFELGEGCALRHLKNCKRTLDYKLKGSHTPNISSPLAHYIQFLSKNLWMKNSEVFEKVKINLAKIFLSLQKLRQYCIKNASSKKALSVPVTVNVSREFSVKYLPRNKCRTFLDSTSRPHCHKVGSRFVNTTWQ